MAASKHPARVIIHFGIASWTGYRRSDARTGSRRGSRPTAVRGVASSALGTSPTGWKPVPHARLPRGTAFQAVSTCLGRASLRSPVIPTEDASPTGWKPVPHERLLRGTAFQAVRECGKSLAVAFVGRAGEPRPGRATVARFAAETEVVAL